MCVEFVNQYFVLEGTSMPSGVSGVNRCISQFVLTTVTD